MNVLRSDVRGGAHTGDRKGCPAREAVSDQGCWDADMAKQDGVHVAKYAVLPLVAKEQGR